MSDTPGTTGEEYPETAADPRDAGELRRTRDAQAAHGGSMAPGLVDATGNPVSEPPPATGPDAER